MPASTTRSLRLLRPPGPDAPGIFCIHTKKQDVYYVFQEIPCHIGGRAFALHRMGLGDLYHVGVGRREECSCECMGFLAHGKCKHIQSLLALIRENRLSPPADNWDEQDSGAMLTALGEHGDDHAVDDNP